MIKWNCACTLIRTEILFDIISSVTLHLDKSDLLDIRSRYFQLLIFTIDINKIEKVKLYLSLSPVKRVDFLWQMCDALSFFLSFFLVTMIGHFAIVCWHIDTHTHTLCDGRIGHRFQQQLSEREREREEDEVQQQTYSRIVDRSTTVFMIIQDPLTHYSRFNLYSSTQSYWTVLFFKYTSNTKSHSLLENANNIFRSLFSSFLFICFF